MTAQAFFAVWTDLSASLGRLVELGLDVEPAGGTSEAWSAALADHAIEPLGEDERFDAARALKQTKGAPLTEVTACLKKAVERGQAALVPLLGALTDEQRRRVQSGLGLLLEEAEKRYREAACAKKKGMFAHARETAQLHQYSVVPTVHGYVLCCPACKAPRLQQDLACVFCGATF